MRTYEISSPAAAELYFNESFVGDVATFVGTVLRKLGGGKSTGRPARRKSARDRAPRPNLLDRLDRWFWRQQQKAQEDYLAGASDVFDLERRIDAIDRGTITRYY
jgi:Protein of unknown function (DUF3563)